MTIPKRQVSSDRRLLYYTGLALSAVGILLFLSTFVTFLANFGNFDNFEARARSGGFRAFGGIACIMLGGFLARVAVRGLAGSGMILDPEKAREDVEPWSRMAGGVARDALSETGLVDGRNEHGTREPQIKVRCQKCSSLNDEDAKFCKQCASAL